MKRILITGSTGYLGSQLTGYLQKRGYDCQGIDTGFFKHGLLKDPPPVSTTFKDVRELTETDLEGYDILIQLAAISNDPFGGLDAKKIYDPTRNYTKQLAAWCKKLGVRFIFPSSCSVYGIGDGSLLNEESQVNPQTPYSLNKVQIEQDLVEMADASFSPIALRFATVFGMSPRIRFDVVINMLCGMAVTEKKVMLNSDGQAWRPHLHIEDVCEAFRCCIDWDYQDGKLMIFNVGRDENNLKILDVAQMIQQQVVGCELTYLKNENPIQHDLIRDRKIQDGVDKRTYRVSFQKVHDVLPGFRCRVSVEAGIQKLIEELREAGLTFEKFKTRDFYRLQQIEYLYKTKQINEDLLWVL